MKMCVRAAVPVATGYKIDRFGGMKNGAPLPFRSECRSAPDFIISSSPFTDSPSRRRRPHR
jgi:hypothetical protein